ncbi:aminotransferase [Sphingomonas sp. SRS2]|nr:aminotransferase [Sphingomonas sp. SRS2]
MQARDAAHHLHSFTDPQVIETQGSRIITRAQGSTVWDSDGNELLDGMAGLWCVNVGYGREELVDAATRQMHELPYYNNHFQSTTPPIIALAEKLATLTPAGLDRFYFGSSGSEANDTIVRMARQYWRIKGQPEKTIFISRTLAYHGTTVAATSLGGMPHMHAMDGTPGPGYSHIDHPHWYLRGDGLTPEEFGLRAARALEERILELGADKVAAFIGEPIQGAGGVIVPPDSYWPEIQRICRKYDILLVADEVICGFGRTGTWFASEQFAIEPDLMPMAKGLSSGYLPISAVAISSRVYDVVSKGGLFAHGYTYSGHPVACAVALANIGIIEREGLVERVGGDIGPYFQSALASLADHPIVGEKRGLGLMAALQLVRDRDSKTMFAPEDNVAIICRDACYAEGLIARAISGSMVLSPPLVVTHSEVDNMVERLGRALDSTAQKFGVL